MFPRVKIHNHTTDRHGKYSGKNDQTRKNEKLKIKAQKQTQKKRKNKRKNTRRKDDKYRKREEKI